MLKVEHSLLATGLEVRKLVEPRVAFVADEVALFEHVNRRVVSGMALSHEMREPKIQGDGNHGSQSFGRVALAPGVFSEDVAGFGRVLGTEAEAGTSEQASVCSGESEVGPTRPGSPLRRAHPEEGGTVLDRAMTWPTDKARHCFGAGQTLEDRLGIP